MQIATEISFQVSVEAEGVSTPCHGYEFNVCENNLGFMRINKLWTIKRCYLDNVVILTCSYK